MTKITVTAASGKLGRAVAAELQSRGLAGNTRLAARNISKLEDFRAAGFDVVSADYDDPASLTAAFGGADVALLISSEGVNEKRARQHRAAIDAAKAAGVKRIVYTSTTNPVPESRFEWAGAHAETEAYLRASGLSYTILRDNSYFANNDPLFEQAKASGVLAFPGASAKVAYVSHEDIAAASVAALTQTGHEEKVYEVSGSDAVSATELGVLLAQITARPIQVVDVPLQAFHDQFKAMGLPDYMVTGLTSFYATLGAGEYAQPSADFERLTGRKSTPAGEYLKKFA